MSTAATRCLTAALLGVSAFAAARLASAAAEITNGIVTVREVSEAGAGVGFEVETGTQHVATVLFGSLRNIRAARAEAVGRAFLAVGTGGPALRFSGLTAEPTPRLGGESFVEVCLLPHDPYPVVRFRLDLDQFDQEAWERVHGEVPFHFLTCSLPGAEIFHQRGWPIPTPVVDDYPQLLAEGPGQQVVSAWSRDWTYAPPIGAYPVPLVGLWKPSSRLFVGYDFMKARLTLHTEKRVGSAYCWRHQEAEQFFTLVWPFAKGYNQLRYPEDGDSVETEFTLLYDTDMPGNRDPNELALRLAYARYLNLLPAVPTVNDVSWYPQQLRLADFLAPRLGRLYSVAPEDATWEEPGAVTAYGVGYTRSPIDEAYRIRDTEAIQQLKEDIGYLLQHAVRHTIEGDECIFWEKPVEGEMARMFGPGVGTIHTVQGWGVAQALLDTYRNEPQAEARLLPYIDGALRFTKHILYTRNDYADVPAAQFAWGAAPVAHFCLQYHHTFRGDPQRARLAVEALELARTMTYRYLPIWISDNDQMDDLDSSYFMEPNSGLSWLGAACANEVWVVCYALAEVYVATGDPILGHLLRGMVDRWHILARDEYYPTVQAQGNAWAERYGLFDESPQAKGTRAGFGGIWGGFEELSWPIGGADVRVLCGERAALAFDQGGLHTNIASYRAAPDGDCSFGLVAIGPEAESRGRGLDVVVTFPFHDLSGQAVRVQHNGTEKVLTDCAAWPHRPDSLLIRGAAHGDTVIIGDVPTDASSLPCEIAKPLTIPEERTIRVGDFEIINLAFGAQQKVEVDWEDVDSMAGFHGGRTVLYGIPFELVPPVLNRGYAAIRGEAVAVGIAPQHLFLLVGDARPGARVDLYYMDGSRESVEAERAVPVIRGWPPVLDWHIDLLHVEVGGKEIGSIRPRKLSLYAVTGTTAPTRELSETLAALADKEKRILAERATIAKLAARQEMFDYFSGHIAVLPVPPPASPQSAPVVRMLRQAGMTDALRMLAPEDLLNAATFTADRFWVALWTGGEKYTQTARTPEDIDQALVRYLAEGGTLLVLPTEPFPFYYNERGDVVVSAPKFGLPICGSGAEDRLDTMEAANARGWEQPPEGRKLTFYRNSDQQILTSIPETFPFPQEGDLRWRPIVNVIGDSGTYTPLITLRDEQGASYGDGAAWIEYTSGPLAGGKAAYIWSTLLATPELQADLINDLFGYVLDNLIPPLARAVVPRADGPIVVDGTLNDAAWTAAQPLPGFSCFLTRRGQPTRPTEARLLWDDQHLYVGFACDDPDAWSTITERDGPLWEGEVVELYADPDGDGRNYKEFEVNPLNTVIDLNIPQVVDGDIGEVADNALWDADGWQTAVRVNGTADNREDHDAGWTCEMAIPLANFADQAAVPPQVGDVWRLQLYRIERPHEPEEPEFSGWSPTDTFHNPSRFGFITFGLSPYQDDFERYPAGSAGEPMWHAAAGTWAVQDGALVGEDSGTDAWAVSGAFGPPLGIADYNLRLRFRILQRGTDWRDGPWIGVRQDGTGNGYTVMFTSRGVQIHKVTPTASTGDNNPVFNAPWMPDNEWHEVLVQVWGRAIAVEVDGEVLVDTSDLDVLGVPPLGAGGIALSARKWTQSEGHTRVAFDDIRVEPIG